MALLPITSTIAAPLAILMFVLTLLVSLRRIQLGKEDGDIAKFVFGHGDDEAFRCRIRAFGNFIEYVPMALLVLAFIELQGAPSVLVWWLGGLFAVGRLLHAIGMLFSPRFPLPRAVGMLPTYAVLLVSAGWLIFNT
ncbi:MAG: MAPEG family protein [Methylophaga sp.]|nr:MAPEG family protein [Methylophaga sp.]